MEEDERIIEELFRSILSRNWMFVKMKLRLPIFLRSERCSEGGRHDWVTTKVVTLIDESYTPTKYYDDPNEKMCRKCRRTQWLGDSGSWHWGKTSWCSKQIRRYNEIE